MWNSLVTLKYDLGHIDSGITCKLSCGHVCKMFVRQWTKEAKIAIFNDPTLQRTPANICINLILPETTFPGLHFFCRWQYMGSSANFRTVLSDYNLACAGGYRILRPQDTSAPVSRHFDAKNVVRDTSTRVPWSRKSRDTSTQDNTIKFDTKFVVPKCPRVSWCRSVLWPKCPVTILILALLI